MPSFAPVLAFPAASENMTTAVVDVHAIPSGLWWGRKPMTKDHGALHRQIDRDEHEADADQSKRVLSALLGDVGELPQDHGRRSDLDQAVKARSLPRATDRAAIATTARMSTPTRRSSRA